MEQFTIGQELGEQLVKLPSQTVLCDTAGRAIGFFSPLPGKPKMEELQLEPPHTIEEINEMRKQRTGKPLSEILDRLGLS